MLRRNRPVVKSVESVLRLEGSLWWERSVKEVKAAASEPHIKQRYKSACSQVWFNSTRSFAAINWRTWNCEPTKARLR